MTSGLSIGRDDNLQLVRVLWKLGCQSLHVNALPTAQNHSRIKMIERPQEIFPLLYRPNCWTKSDEVWRHTQGSSDYHQVTRHHQQDYAGCHAAGFQQGRPTSRSRNGESSAQCHPPPPVPFWRSNWRQAQAVTAAAYWSDWISWASHLLNVLWLWIRARICDQIYNLLMAHLSWCMYCKRFKPIFVHKISRYVDRLDRLCKEINQESNEIE